MELGKSRVRWKKEKAAGEVERILFSARDTRQLCTQEAAPGQWRQERGSRAVGPYFSSSGGVQGVGGVEDSLGFGTVALKLKAMTEAVGDQLPRLL